MVKSTTARFIHPWFVSNYDKAAKNQTKGAFLFSLNCPVLTIIDNKNVLTAGVKDSNAQLGKETKKKKDQHKPSAFENTHWKHQSKRLPKQCIPNVSINYCALFLCIDFMGYVN